MSVVKTMRKVQEGLAWEFMKKDITNFIKQCPVCIVHAKVVPRAPMGEIPITIAPMQIVAADLIGPLVKSFDNNQYILTCIDHCTGWAEAFAIPCKSSKEVSLEKTIKTLLSTSWLPACAHHRFKAGIQCNCI